MDSQQRPPRRAVRQRGPRPHTDIAEMTRGIPVVPLRNAVVLPQAIAPLFVEDERTRRAIDTAQHHDGVVLAIAQRSEQIEHPEPYDLYTVGVEAIVEKRMTMPNGMISVMLRSVRRLRVRQFIESAPFMLAEVEPIPESYDDGPATIAMLRVARQHFEQAAHNSVRITEEALSTVIGLQDPGAVADAIAMTIDLPLATRQSVLETINPLERLKLVDQLLVKELAIIEVEARIHQTVQQEIDRGQKEYYLREQIKAIQRELSEHDPGLHENLELRERVLAAGMSVEAQERALRELDRLEGMPSMAPEYTVVRTYLDWLLALPWKQMASEQFDLAAATAILDANHFGLKKIKERLIEFIAVRKIAPTSRTPILCFVGPPGVGKTSLGRSIAQALGRKFVRISLGGVRDEAEIRGHRRTYVGALPGRILQTMRHAGAINPVFVLDEVDKLASDYRGDPSSALLEVLDPEQNFAFSDHYLEVPYDLSKVIFVCTANTLHPIPSALQDRMEVIELAGYTEEEKVHIARQFLIPKQTTDHGLSATKIEVRDDAVRRVIADYTHEAGVRNLEREISSVMRKVARRVAEGKRGKVTLTAPKVPDYLGPQRNYSQEAETTDQVGLAMGVAWTPAGGELTPVEVAVLEGRGQILLTGQLGDVLRESAQAAVSFARGRARELHLLPAFHEKYDLHIHMPMGAVPKDGPSAGVPISIALISALTGRPVRHDVAMTGEISLRGRVLPVGGVKEKTLAAFRAGLHHLVLPRKNLRDLEELTQEVRDAIQFHPVESLDEVLGLALGLLATNHAQPTILATEMSVPVPVSTAPEHHEECVIEVQRPAEKPNALPAPATREPQPRAIAGAQ